MVLQERWKPIEYENDFYLLYYGVRNPPKQSESLIPITKNLFDLIRSDKYFDSSSHQEIQNLIDEKIIVFEKDKNPEITKENMQVCKTCVTNNYVVPGLEFNEEGVCALCQCYEKVEPSSNSIFTTITEDELLEATKTNTSSRFDAMIFYTGGKDSSYMLWLLARKLKLRVLAAFWNMPYCSSEAYNNIKRAKETMPDVEFVEWTIPLDTVRKAMNEKWKTQGWPCLCPTAAFPTLYPLAADLKVPYIFLGLEDVQASVVEYVVKPKSKSSKPLTPREQTIAFLNARAIPRQQKMPVVWPDEMANYHAAVNQGMPELFKQLADLLEKAQADKNIHLPLISRFSTNKEYGTWNDAKSIIEKEMGWRAPEGQNSLLHTSCAIEPVKDYLQFQRFKNMRTIFMPQSIIEMGAAVYFGLTDREDALEAVEELGYWEPPKILDKLADDLLITKEEVNRSSNELSYSLQEWANHK